MELKMYLTVLKQSYFISQKLGRDFNLPKNNVWKNYPQFLAKAHFQGFHNCLLLWLI